jgi:chemotaxis protein CheD
MGEIIYVETGRVRSAIGSAVLKSSGIGSCVVVVGFSPKALVGAMAHIMLPGPVPDEVDVKKRFRYAPAAIEELVGQLCRTGLEVGEIEACIIGGANVLNDPKDHICEANINAVKNFLGLSGVPIRKACLGGFQRRSVTFDIARRFICRSTGNGKEELFYEISAAGIC